MDNRIDLPFGERFPKIGDFAFKQVPSLVSLPVLNLGTRTSDVLCRSPSEIEPSKFYSAASPITQGPWYQDYLPR